MTIQHSRRAFIKIAAGTGAGLVMGLDLPYFGQSRHAFRAEPFRARRA